MLEVEEAGPEFSVILAVHDPECSRLLAILFDGFGYRILECRDAETLEQRLRDAGDIHAAVIDLSLPKVEDICHRIREHASVPILALCPGDPAEAAPMGEKLRCDALEPLRAEPERWLVALRRLIIRDEPERDAPVSR